MEEKETPFYKVTGSK